MLNCAVATEEVADLLSRYSNIAPRERRSVQSWVRGARYVPFAQLLSQAESAANLSRACVLDSDLRGALQAQANRQLLYATAVFLTVTIWALASVW